MAGALLDDLIDVLSDDEPAVEVKEFKDYTGEEAAASVDPEDYFRRAVQMSAVQRDAAQQQVMVDPGSFADSSNAGVSPEEKIDYYRRMVQMHEMMRTGGYESVAQIAEDDDEDQKDPSAKSLQVCSEFFKGECKNGLKCRFVHEGAFRKGGNTDNDDGADVDPEDFIRRALQLRTLQQKSSRKAAARANTSSMLSFLGGFNGAW